MGPEHRPNLAGVGENGLKPVGTDQVKRAEEFLRRHREIVLVWPRGDMSPKHTAVWADGSGIIHSDPQLRVLLDWLEAEIGHGRRPGDPR